MRLRLEDIERGEQFETGREKMRGILQKRGLSKANIERLIREGLDAAADHQLERIRREGQCRDRDQGTQYYAALIGRLENLVRTISALPPTAIGRLNRASLRNRSEFFDSETFAELIELVGREVQDLKPKRRADDVHATIFEPSNIVVRTSPSEIIDGWNMLPPATRSNVEAAVRAARPTKSVTELLSRLIALLHEHVPAQRSGRPPMLTGRLVRRVAAAWAAQGLRVGRATDQHGVSQPSVFQQFCNAALAAVGDPTTISDQDVRNLKRDLAGRHKAPVSR
jgi:hypothetical protein